MDDRELIEAIRNHAADVERAARPVEDLVPDVGEPPERRRREVFTPLVAFLRRSRVALAAAAIVLLAFIPVMLFEGSGDEADVADGPIETSAPTAPPTTVPTSTTASSLPAGLPAFVVAHDWIEGTTGLPFAQVDLVLPDGSELEGVTETDSDGGFFLSLASLVPGRDAGDQLTVIVGGVATPIRLAQFEIGNIDPASDVVVGTWDTDAPISGALVTVRVSEGDRTAEVETRLGDRERFSADFSGVFDVTGATTAEVRMVEGRVTFVDFGDDTGSPYLMYSIPRESLVGDGLSPGMQVEVSVDGEVVVTGKVSRYGDFETPLSVDDGATIEIDDGSHRVGVVAHSLEVEIDSTGRIATGRTGLPDAEIVDVQLFDTETDEELLQFEVPVVDGRWRVEIPPTSSATFRNSSYTVAWRDQVRGGDLFAAEVWR